MLSGFSDSRPLPSLRLWLLSTSLLAVLAGYGVLFLVGSHVRRQERFSEHQRIVDVLLLDVRDSSPQVLNRSSPGLQLVVVPSGQPSSPRLQTTAEGSSWLVSRHWVGLPSGSPLVEVRQNVTAQRQQDRTDQLLLVAAAGGSMLFTAMLLRLVLQRGLIRPLEGLRIQLNALEADSLGEQSIDLATQPGELQPIAQAFNALQQRLSSAWQRERAFVDGVAHELRTPIAVISAQAQRLMQEGGCNAPGTAPALMASEADRMGELVRVLMDFARSDSGRLQIQSVEVDPELLLVEVYERLLPLAPSRLQLAPASEQVLPQIRVDSERVQQCLAALVDNAIKYSSKAITLSCDVSQNRVTLHVRDIGSGIPPQEHGLVLERFARGSTAIGTRGSGIGLATVSMLMQAMDGKLVIADRPGGGADLQLCFRLLDRPSAP